MSYLSMLTKCRSSFLRLILLCLITSICIFAFLGTPNFSLFQNTQNFGKGSANLEEFVLPTKQIASVFNLSVCTDEQLDQASEKPGVAQKLFSGIKLFQALLLENFNQDSFTTLVDEIKTAHQQIATKKCLPPMTIGGESVQLETGVRVVLDDQIITCGFSPQVSPLNINQGIYLSESINNYISFIAQNKVIKKSEKSSGDWRQGAIKLEIMRISQILSK